MVLLQHLPDLNGKFLHVRVEGGTCHLTKSAGYFSFRVRNTRNNGYSLAATQVPQCPITSRFHQAAGTSENNYRVYEYVIFGSLRFVAQNQALSTHMRALFTSFPASDYDVSTRFYEQAVGLKLLRDFDGTPQRFKNYDLDGMVLKVYEWTENYYGSGHSGLFIETDDLDGVVNRIRKYGGKTTEIVVHRWGGRCCSVTDPFGNIFDLIDANQKGNA